MSRYARNGPHPNVSFGNRYVSASSGLSSLPAIQNGVYHSAGNQSTIGG